MGGKPDNGDPSVKTITIIGGGLAGLSAARHLLDRDYSVLLIEKRPFLGGRVFSFRDSRVDCEIDNGQHVLMGCFTYLRDLLNALKSADKIYLQDRLRTEIVLNGKHGLVSSTPLLGPLHLLASFMRYPHLGLRDKLLAVYALIKIKLTDRFKNASSLDEQTFYHWLRKHHQSERAINNLWNLIILPTVNDDIRNVSAHIALVVIQEGLLSTYDQAALGFSRVGLTSLTGAPAQTFIEERGGQLMLGKTAKSLRMEGGLISGLEVSGGDILKSDAYISALPFEALSEVLPKELGVDPFFSNISQLTSSPIVGIHLWYDRPIMSQDFLGFLDSPIQWIFNKNRIQDLNDDEEQHLCISVSAAWDIVNKPKAELKELFSQEMARLFPQAKDAIIQHFLVVKQPQATLRCMPGVARYRPASTTPIPNLFLAGDWIDTGWPSTMESAVRSGIIAAENVIAHI